MAGTKLGGKRAAETNKRNHGESFYKNIGAVGGATPTTKLKGFAANRKLARTAGVLGGRKSRRTKNKER